MAADRPPTRSPLSRRRNVTYAAIGVGILAMLAVLAGLLLRGPDTTPPAVAPGTPPPPPLHVSPTGRDSDDGSAGAPLRTIQAALDRARPGVTINLAPGVYRERPVTSQDGAPGAPITIKGPETGKDRAGRYQAVVYGTGRVFSIDNSHYTLQGFTIDGQEKLAGTPYPTELATIDAWKKSVQDRVEDGRLIYIGAAESSRDLTGITITDMFLNGAGGECIRIRNNAHDNAVTDSVIQYCGLYGKDDGGERATFHNGEGVYIGTSPKSDDQPMHDDDGSARNLVARNVIRTFGSECFNVKENAHDNVFEDNVCSDNAESAEYEGSNVELRGYLNVVRNNKIADSAGYTIKIQSDGEDYDNGGNVVENNHLSGFAATAFKIKAEAPQGRMCGNVVTVPAARLVNGNDPGGITAPC
jgi:hypothetical protein